MLGRLIICLLAAALTSQEVEQETRYAEMLRERGLHRLAVLQTERLRQRSELGPADLTRVDIELSKCLAHCALNSRPPERDAYWQRALDVIDEALSDQRDRESLLLLRAQRGLAMVLRAEWSRREAEVRGANQERRQEVGELIRAAIKQLAEVARELDRPQRRGDEAEVLSRQALRRNLAYQLANAYRNQALTFNPGSADRVNSLTMALQELRPLAASTAVDELVWLARLEQIRCYRLLQDKRLAAESLSRYLEANPPSSLVGPLRAERIRLALDGGQPQEAERLVEEFAAGRTDGPTDLEFELARIETLAALAQGVPGQPPPPNAAEFRERASNAAALLGRRRGPYWALRAEMLIASLAEAGSGPGDVELLATAAKSYLQRDMPEDAAGMLRQASRQAAAAGDAQQAFQFRVQAAAVERQRGDLGSSVEQLREAALEYAHLPTAARTHLLAVFDAATLYQQAAGESSAGNAAGALERYRELLDEHLTRWPQSTSADQARLWRGRLHEALREDAEAVQRYRSIPVDSAYAAAGVTRLGRIYRRTLATGEDETQRMERLREAREWLDGQAQAASDAGAASAVDALIEAARLRLFVEPCEYQAADAGLRRAQSFVEPSAAAAGLVDALLVVAQAGEQQLAGAHRKLAQAVPLPADALVEVLQGLRIVRDSRPDDKELTTVVASVVKLLTTYQVQLSRDDQRLLDEMAADVQGETDPVGATQVYARLARDFPSAARIQRRYAELLDDASDDTSRQTALRQWRLVVRQSRPRSPTWFRGKLGVATALYQLGSYKQAHELIALLVSLYPDLGGPSLKHEFTQLLELCER